MIKVSLIFLFIIFISNPILAKPITTFDEALNLVFFSVLETHFSALSIDCVVFSGNEQDNFYYIEIDRLYNQQCGSVQEKLLKPTVYEINKKTGEIMLVQ